MSLQTAAPGELDYTGERMVPSAADHATFWEHVERYRFAVALVKGTRALDIACGEGYGTAALVEGGATSVVGVDLSAEACLHAQQKYGVDARVGSAERIPLDDGAVDAVVSFETIEHVPSPEQFIRECRRVLRPGGRLIISTPNKEEYHKISPSNPFHCSEMSVGDFRAMLKEKFANVELFGQCMAPPWHWRILGLRRISRILQSWTDPRLSAALDASLREQAVELILRRRAALERSLNPWLVRNASDGELDSARYVIALAS